MTKYESLKNKFQLALRRLEEVLAEEKTELVRDAALKRFEFTFDLAWKLLRAFLEEEKGVSCLSPKDCIREAYRQGLITYDNLWLSITDWRNRIVHEYGEEFADELYERLPDIYGVFKELEEAIHKTER